MKFPVGRILGAVVVTVLSVALLLQFPFYPVLIALALAVVLGAIALEFPSVALWLGIILSMFAGFYQNPFLGITYFIVFLCILALTTSWLQIAFVAASWVLALSSLPALALVPLVLAGDHLRGEHALRVGAVSAISCFLLCWSVGLRQAGLMLIPFAAPSLVMQPVQNPWQFTAFLPNLNLFTSQAIMSYYAPMLTNLEDLRAIILVVIWIVTGYIVGFLADKFKLTARGILAVAGCLPVVAVAAVLGSSSFTGLAVALVGSILAVVAYNLAKPALALPAIRTFTRLKDLIPTGVPGSYSILLGSPACEERNLIVELFIRSGVGRQAPCFDLTADVGYGRNLLSKFPQGLTLLIGSPRAAEATEKNVIRISSGIQNLTTINIELVNAVKDHYQPGSVVCLEAISDILLSQKLLTTRKWITDLTPRLEGWGYTVLGVFNPALHSKEENQGITDLFKGYIEITEKDYAGKQRRMIAVRKMIDVKYNEGELLLDRDQLLDKGKQAAGLRGRLIR